MAVERTPGVEKVYQVSELTGMIKRLIETQFGPIWLEGELSNVSRPASGHLYFTLKDERAQIRAVMWRGDCRGLTFSPTDGSCVRVFGALGVYERGGIYQIIVRHMAEAGAGALQAAFEALKKKLQAEGLFDSERKRPLPLLPRHVGVVTSPTGAAIRDILNVVSRRFPNIHLVLAPVRVQGEGAGQEIADAVDLLSARGDVDVVIVGRGGGSLEDLWSFNEERVARAIARSRVPVISAVGHEIDFTISDFVADLRAPTPSAAAELVVGRKEEFVAGLEQYARRLVHGLQGCLLLARNRLAAAGRSYVFREPANRVAAYRQSVAALSMKMTHRVADRWTGAQQRTDELHVRLSHVMEKWLAVCRERLRALTLQTRALSPAGVLQRGYSISRLAGGQVIRDAGSVHPGQRVHTTVARGTFESEVIAGHEQSQT